jgi:hypothetical protein
MNIPPKAIILCKKKSSCMQYHLLCSCMNIAIDITTFYFSLNVKCLKNVTFKPAFIEFQNLIHDRVSSFPKKSCIGFGYNNPTPTPSVS